MLALSPMTFAQESAPDTGWIELFNGTNLENWTPKFAGHPAGTNYRNTFRVENGLLTVSYDNYEEFNNTFGHLFHESRFSNYKLHAEYRFVGNQPKGAGAWAYRNNGLMLHAQSPESMRLNQEFPVSIEVQLLGGRRRNEPRPTANLCTPGTNVRINGNLITRHCTDSRSATYHGDQWVTVEVVVRGSDIIHHIVNGDTVMSYRDIQYDPRNSDAQKLIQARNDTLLEGGYISIQAESHPTQFKSIKLKPIGE